MENFEKNKIYCGDCLDVLKTFPNESVNCCVTSPPYYGLRDYGTAIWIGGDNKCDHSAAKEKSRYDYSLKTSLIQNENRKGTDAPKWKSVCPICGAIKVDNQIGLEETPEQYVQKLVAVFSEVKRVLKKDGTLFLNLGDSYWGSGTGKDKSWENGKNLNSLEAKSRGRGLSAASGNNITKRTGYHNQIKPKDLIGIPWMVAFALRADGWYLRQDIIWHKPNPMPESVTDRCTKSHEYIFLLAKSQKYYYDNKAIAEDSVCFDTDKRSINGPTILDRMEGSQYQCKRQGVYSSDGLRNKRSVWTVNTTPYSEAHFATFPEKLIVDMIKAGCPKDGIVLDPFMGAGTTGLVARKLNCNYVGIELNPEYVKIAEKRIFNEIGLFL